MDEWFIMRQGEVSWFGQSAFDSYMMSELVVTFFELLIIESEIEWHILPDQTCVPGWCHSCS